MKINRETIKEIAENLFKNTESQERRLKGYINCITNGFISLDAFTHCGDNKCPSCNTTSKALEDEARRLAFKFYDKK